MSAATSPRGALATLGSLARGYRFSLVLTVFSFAALMAAVAPFAMPHEAWGDEEHFVTTSILFGRHLTLDTLRSYPELSTPLPFVVYGLWGRLLGFDLLTLRLLSPLIALATYVMLHFVLHRWFEDGRIAFLGTLFVMLNPYMVGLSVFVFTDMITILAILVAFHGAWKEHWGRYALAAGCALLARQYAAFLVLSVCGWHGLRLLSDPAANRRAFASAV